MVKLINKWTGAEMWVAENRVEEYLAAGHKLVAKPTIPVPKKRNTRKKSK